MKAFILLCLTLLTVGGGSGGGGGGSAHAASVKCEKTITTASFRKASHETKLCSGDLIFENTFDTFDLDVWQHDITLSTGDRVSE